MTAESNFPDALREAGGFVISELRREWRRERELIEAQSQQVIADLRAQNAELRTVLHDYFNARVREIETTFETKISARLAQLKDGKDGMPGVQGPPGPAGESLVGPPGRDGESIVGPAGAKGDKGEPGESIVGPAGEKGEPGASIVGPKGDKGDPGIAGKDGRDGIDGAPGRDGVDGKDGAPGLIGKDGMNGKDGRDGINGKDGAPGRAGIDGKDGERGPVGPPGKLPKVREWLDGVHYEGDVVTRDGALYQAQRDTAKEPGKHVDWLCLAAAGRDGADGANGADGRSLTIRGTYSDKLKYQAGDVVTLNATWFVARKNDPGPCPGPDWQSGPTGRRGEKGERGAKGERGEPGAAGREIVGFTVTEDFTLQAIYSDGAEGPKVSVRKWFENYHQERHG